MFKIFIKITSNFYLMYINKCKNQEIIQNDNYFNNIFQEY